MIEQAQEVGGRIVQADLQGVFIERFDAQGLGRQLAGQHLAGVSDRQQHLRVIRRGLRIGAATQCKYEIFGQQRVAIRPAGIAAQVKSVGLAIAADVPAGGR